MQDVGDIDMGERASLLQGIGKGVHRLAHSAIGEQTLHVVKCLGKNRLHLITLQLTVVTSVVTGGIKQLITQLLVNLVVIEHHASAQHVGYGQSDRDAVMSQDILPSASRREPRIAGKEKLGRELDAARCVGIECDGGEQVAGIEHRESQRHTCSAITPIQFVTIFH